MQKAWALLWAAICVAVVGPPAIAQEFFDEPCLPAYPAENPASGDTWYMANANGRDVVFLGISGYTKATTGTTANEIFSTNPSVPTKKETTYYDVNGVDWKVDSIWAWNTAKVSVHCQYYFDQQENKVHRGTGSNPTGSVSLIGAYPALVYQEEECLHRDQTLCDPGGGGDPEGGGGDTWYMCYYWVYEDIYGNETHRELITCEPM